MSIKRADKVNKVLVDNFMPYAMSVIVSRAIPEIDGFKPSHRKLLYTMYKMGLLKGGRAKSADIVGQTMALNPHGDQAIYETMVRLTRGNGTLIHPWIDSKGNFGKSYSRDMAYAAYRYTEAKLDSSCETIFADLNKDSVDFIDNYSGTMKEPVLLPASFPTILVNYNQGIAVGMASHICSFNLSEVCKLTAALIEDEDLDLLDFMPAPDFSTGAKLIYNEAEMRQIYQTGRGSFKLRAKYKVDKKNSCIEVYEIPYSTSIEAIIEDVAKNVKNGKIKEVTDVRDETDLNGLKITIDYKRSTDIDLLIQKLYKMTAMESSFSCNFNLLIDNKPLQLGVREILLEWLSWRRSCVKRTVAYEIGEKEKALHHLYGLEKILLDIDQAIKIIRETKLEKDVITNLRAGFKIDQVQAEAVAEIKLRQLNREYLLRRLEEIKELEAAVKKLKKIYQSQKLLDQLIQKQVLEVSKKYGRERKTSLIAEEKITSLTSDDLIEDYNLKLFFTKDGYLKKLPLTSLRSAGDLKLKEEDEIIQEFETTNKSEVLLFSDQGRVYKQKTYEILDHKPSDFGEYTPSLVEAEEDERIVKICPVNEDYAGEVILAFANGRVVRLELAHYLTKTNRKRLINAFYSKSKLVDLHLVEAGENLDLVLFNSENRLLLFDTSLIPIMSTRTASGIRLIRQKKEFQVLKLDLATNYKDVEYYRVRTLPAAGRFIKEPLLTTDMLTMDQLL